MTSYVDSLCHYANYIIYYMIDAVFLGDSWLDDKWNEHKTWGTIIAESEGWSYINLSKAGCTTDYILNILKTLKNIDVSEHTRWIIHIGGNDLLYWVINNPSRVIYDIWKREKHFFKNKGDEIASHIYRIVDYIVTHHNASKITISSNTACYGVPLCRAFGMIYTPFTSKQHMDLITADVNLALLRVIQDLTRLHNRVHFTFYNECKTCIEKNVTISWKWDLFHPCEQSHHILAESFKRSIELPLQDHIAYFVQLKESSHIYHMYSLLFIILFTCLGCLHVTNMYATPKHVQI